MAAMLPQVTKQTNHAACLVFMAKTKAMTARAHAPIADHWAFRKKSSGEASETGQVDGLVEPVKPLLTAT